MSFFSPDSMFMRIMSRVADLLILNVLFLITSVPVVTIGAASTALYTVCFRLGTDREAGTVKTYFSAFRDNFKQATPLWLLLLLCGGAAGFNTMLFYTVPGAARFACALFGILFIVVLFVHAYVFPMLSLFNSDNKSLLKNALILSLGYLPRSILAAALNILPLGCLLLNFYGFFQAGFVWIALYFSAAAYANTFILKKVFAPYLREENKTED